MLYFLDFYKHYSLINLLYFVKQEEHYIQV